MIRELEFWQEVINSPQWKYLLEVYQKHSEHLQKKANEHLRKGEYELARVELAKKDADRSIQQAELLRNVLRDLDLHNQATTKMGDEILRLARRDQ